jgi:PiT family inorganic phosphate transporter
VRRKKALDETSLIDVVVPTISGHAASAYPLPHFSLRQMQDPALPTGIATVTPLQRLAAIRGLGLSKLLDHAHFASAGLVSFARGMNDTPKIAAIMLVIHAVKPQWAFAVIGIAMAIGGLLQARKVAETMSNKITSMNHGQGFTANLVTGILVIFASRLGIPVSTTHVSVGALCGIGMATRQANMPVLRNIFLSWLLTLPIAAIFSGLFYLLTSGASSASTI